eukprot:15483764-Alexandrium_andersonii.AAC.1
MLVPGPWPNARVTKNTGYAMTAQLDEIRQQWIPVIMSAPGMQPAAASCVGMGALSDPPAPRSQLEQYDE